jgi:hypothetical protein
MSRYALGLRMPNIILSPGRLVLQVASLMIVGTRQNRRGDISSGLRQLALQRKVVDSPETNRIPSSVRRDAQGLKPRPCAVVLDVFWQR